MELSGAIAVITGGTGTIGGEIANHLEAVGAIPVLWDRDTGTDHAVVSCDVGDQASVERAMKSTIERFGVPRVLVNVAGLSGGLARRAAEVSTDEDWDAVLSPTASWESVLSVNVMGVVNTSRAFARTVVDAGGGASSAIVNITSISGGPIADPSLAAYSTSKAAVHMLTRLSAADFGPLGIQVNAIAPGFMETRMKPTPGQTTAATMPPAPTAGNDIAVRVAKQTPLGGRNGRPDDIARAVLAVLGADFVTGQVIAVDGGLSQRSLTRGTV